LMVSHVGMSLMIGFCANCGNEVVRPYPADLAICDYCNPQQEVRLRFKVDVPPCPDCGKPMRYLGCGIFECRNLKCKVIEVPAQIQGGVKLKLAEAKRAAI